MRQDSGIDSSPSTFPGTQLTVIAALRHKEQAVRTRAWESLVRLYWKPVYRYIRIKWSKSSEDAKDLTQGFFTRSLEKSFFDKYDPGKARFRTFLRACLDGFVSNQEKAAKAVKRGGAAILVSLDFPAMENVRDHSADSPDEIFERDWIRSLFEISLDTFRGECEKRGKAICYRLFEKYDIDRDPEKGPSYKELAAEFGISASDVTNFLSYARREFRRIVLEKLREVTATEEEFRSDARKILGIKIE